MHIDAQLLFLAPVLLHELWVAQLDSTILLSGEYSRLQRLNFVDRSICALSNLANLFKHAPIYIDKWWLSSSPRILPLLT